MTAGTAVSPAASTLAQTIKTWTLNQSDDEYITAKVTFAITTVGTTVNISQDVPLIVNIGSNAYTVNAHPFTTTVTGAGQKTIWPVEFTAVSRAGDTVTAQLAGGLIPDVATLVNVIAFKIVAESGTQSGT